MPERRGSRFALEVLFLVALMSALMLTDLGPLPIAGVMLVGWLIAAGFEWAASRNEAHFGSGLPPRYYVPQVSLPPARPLEQVGAGYPEQRDEAPTWIASAAMREQLLGGEWPVASYADDPLVPSAEEEADELSAPESTGAVAPAFAASAALDPALEPATGETDSAAESPFAMAPAASAAATDPAELRPLPLPSELAPASPVPDAPVSPAEAAPDTEAGSTPQPDFGEPVAAAGPLLAESRPSPVELDTAEDALAEPDAEPEPAPQFEPEPALEPDASARRRRRFWQRDAPADADPWQVAELPLESDEPPAPSVAPDRAEDSSASVDVPLVAAASGGVARHSLDPLVEPERAKRPWQRGGEPAAPSVEVPARPPGRRALPRHATAVRVGSEN